MENYIKYLRSNNFSLNTIKTYQAILKNYQNIWYDIRLIKKKLFCYVKKPNTIWTHYNVICSYMKFCKDKRLEKFKEIKLPPIAQKYMPVFTKKYLLRKTEDLSNYKNVIIRMLFETGLRASELNNIKEINKKTLLVIGKGNKLREVIHNHETTKLFHGYSYSTKTLRLWVKEVLGEEYTPHSIRRSHATHMLLRGADPKMVMMQLGHTKIETTYKYLHLSIEKNKKIYDKYF